MGLSTPRPAERQSLPGVTAAFRVYRTAGGELCREDDSRAAFLAYPEGTVIPVGTEEQAYYVLTHPEPVAVLEPDEPKLAPAPANKMVKTSTANKGVSR
jgi:hypothetical protein